MHTLNVNALYHPRILCIKFVNTLVHSVHLMHRHPFHKRALNLTLLYLSFWQHAHRLVRSLQYALT